MFVNAADPIALDISEGYGRFHYEENKNFCYYSPGSAKETLTATVIAMKRNPITQPEFAALNEKLDRYFRLMNGYIGPIKYIC